MKEFQHRIQRKKNELSRTGKQACEAISYIYLLPSPLNLQERDPPSLKKGVDKRGQVLRLPFHQISTVIRRNKGASSNQSGASSFRPEQTLAPKSINFGGRGNLARASAKPRRGPASHRVASRRLRTILEFRTGTTFCSKLS